MHREQLTCKSLLSLLSDGDSDALLSWKRDESLLSSADDEDVIKSSGEDGAGGVLDVYDIEGAGVSVSGGDDSDSTQVMTAGDHAEGAGIKSDVLGDGAGLDVDDDGVVDLDVGVGVSDGSGVVGDDEWNTLGSNADLVDTEVLVGSLKGDDVHESSWEVDIGSDLAVDLDQSLHEDLLDLLTGESVVQSVTEEENEWETLTLLVGSLGWLRGVHAGKLVQHPVVGSIKPLQMLLLTSGHDLFGPFQSVRQSKSDSKMG